MKVAFKVIITLLYMLVAGFSWFFVAIFLFGFMEPPEMKSQIAALLFVYVYIFSYIFLMSKKTKLLYRRLLIGSVMYFILAALFVSKYAYEDYMKKKYPYDEKPQIVKETMKIDFGLEEFKPYTSDIHGDIFEANFDVISDEDELVKKLPKLSSGLRFYRLESQRETYIYDENKKFVTCYGVSKHCFDRLGFAHYNEKLMEMRNYMYPSVSSAVNEKNYDWKAMFAKTDIESERVVFGSEHTVLNTFLTDYFRPTLYIKLHHFNKEKDLEMLNLRRYLGAYGIAIIESDGKHYVFYNASNNLENTYYEYALAEATYSNGTYTIEKNPADHSSFEKKEKDDLYLAMIYDRLLNEIHSYNSEKQENYKINNVQREKETIEIIMNNEKLNNIAEVTKVLGEEIQRYKVEGLTYQIVIVDERGITKQQITL